MSAVAPAQEKRKRVRDMLPASLRRTLGGVKRLLLKPWSDKAWIPESHPSLEISLQALRLAGFLPRRCIDVGAYQGDWTKLFRSVFPESRVLMIEAQESKRDVLERLASASHGGVELKIALLGSIADVEVAFHERATGSSVFDEQSHAPGTTIRKTTRTLDAVADTSIEFHQPVDFLKLDVQGYELEILKGASRVLNQAEAVLMEASFIPINAGCPLIYEVMTFMDDRGYQLIDFCSLIRRKDGTVWQTDLLFLRKNSRFLPVPRLNSQNWF